MNRDFLASLQAEIASLRVELDKDPRFLKLKKLQDVLALYNESASSGAVTLRAALDSEVASTTQEPPQATQGRRSADWRFAATELTSQLLSGRSDPTPTRALVAAMVERGISIGGKDPVSNLSAVLSKAGKFRAVGRSGWLLLEHPVPAGYSAERDSGLEETDTNDAAGQSLQKDVEDFLG